jgi:hypothetical protein
LETLPDRLQVQGAGVWTNPGNVTASDNVYATRVIKLARLMAFPGDSSPPNLSISALGFAVPASATILGITATFEHKCSSAVSSCNTDPSGGGKIQLTKTAATGQGTNKGNTTYWGTSDSTETLGSGTDLWGSTWTVMKSTPPDSG